LCLLFVCGIAGAGQVSREELVRRAAELSDQGKIEEAESALLSALKIMEADAQPNRKLAEMQHHLGTVYKELGRLPEAEKWYQRSLSTWKESAGKDDPSIVKPLISLTSLYLESGMASRAEWLLGSWARDPIQTMHWANPQAVRLLHNLAALEYVRRRRSRAETLYRRALEAAEITFGPRSPEVGLLLNNLGMLLADSGRKKEAGSHLERALAIQEEALPSGDPDVARALTNLAAFYCSNGGYADAEPLF
jgi:tetratricopeptide (TPR) repeat protein